MDQPMEPDPVLRSLAADLARDDPGLAALLAGPVPPRRPSPARTVVVVLLLTALLTPALVLAPTVTVGGTAVLLALASPLLVCRLCAADRPPPRPR